MKEEGARTATAVVLGRVGKPQEKKRVHLWPQRVAAAEQLVREQQASKLSA